MTETCHICHGSGSVQSLSPSERAIPQPKTEPEPVVPRVLAFVVRLFPNDLFGRLAHDANIAALFELFDLPKLASGVRSSIVPAVVYVQSFGHDSRQVSIDRFDDVFVEDDHIFGVVNGKPGRWRLRSLGYKNAISINIQGAHIPPNRRGWYLGDEDEIAQLKGLLDEDGNLDIRKLIVLLPLPKRKPTDEWWKR